MKLRIRTKFIGILLLAAVLPLVLALVVAETLGFRYYKRAQGTLLEARAEDLAHSLGLAVSAQIANLDDWIALSDIPARVAATAAQTPLTDAEFKLHLETMEAAWPTLAADAEPLRGLLQNEIADGLRAFQTIHPLFVELLATDARGQLVGATGKTTDYWQADEEWWQRAFTQRWNHVYVEGIHFDESAGVYSVDVAVPIRDWRHSGDPPVGVIKGVINASPLLSSVAPTLSGDAAVYQVVLGDGRILAQLTGGKIEPLTDRLPPATAAKLGRKSSGWLLAPGTAGTEALAGHAPLRIGDAAGDGLEVTGLSPMNVLVSIPATVVFAPARKQVLLVGGAGTVLILASAFLAYWLAGRKIIDPLEALRTVARAIGATAKLGDAAPEPRPLPALEPIRRIRTGDELQDLAQEFAYMAGRVLTYSERLETDLAAKTAAIEADLQMAREFQEALMPHTYPKVPSSMHVGKIGLEFHHIYRPASSVGGDFFDVFKLSDHRAGIFIADVMGHGARSALVTAILRALLQNLASTTCDPAQFLALLNAHFHEIVRQSEETIFVTAFYVIIDTETATACYASAGHPSPFIADCANRAVRPLFDNLKSNPALGLFPGAAYDKWTRVVQPGDIFLLFTDGVHEAYNAAGEEFGLDRLRDLVAANLSRPSSELSQTVVDAVHAFIQPATPADDICLVTVEVTAAPAVSLPTQIAVPNADGMG